MVANEEFIRIVVVGGGGVGKSCCTTQFIKNEFTDEYDPTIENSFQKRLTIGGKTYTLEILDTAGQEEYRGMSDEALRAGQGFLIVYAINHEASFREGVKSHLDEIRMIKEIDEDDAEGGGVPILIVGNKTDLEHERVVTTAEGAAYAASVNCRHFETSAKTGAGIEEVFNTVARLAVNNDPTGAKASESMSRQSLPAASSKRKCTLV